jgi:hypothetical protein
MSMVWAWFEDSERDRDSRLPLGESWSNMLFILVSTIHDSSLACLSIYRPIYTALLRVRRGMADDQLTWVNSPSLSRETYPCS